jgi:deoxyribonucleoside regulator
VDKDELLMAAAAMHYVQDMKMEAIASRLHISRSSVSRLLKLARETGIVEISIRPPPTRAPQVARELRQRYGIETHVVPVSDSAGREERLRLVAMTAAKVLASWVESDMIVGVAWGTTLEEIARHLPRKTTRGSVVVQLNGAVNSHTSGVEYAGSLIARFGEAFEASVQLFPVPAFFDFAETRRAMWREKSISRVLELQQRADVAVFSMGTLSGEQPSRVYSAGYLEPKDAAALFADKVVGDVCTVFLRADGSYADLPINERATGLSPGELRKIPRRLCAVAGDEKVLPLLAGLRAGVVTHLVIDERTAASLVNHEVRSMKERGSVTGDRPKLESRR